MGSARGRRDAADPRGARRGSSVRDASRRGSSARSRESWGSFDDDDSESGGKTIGIALAMIICGLLLGAGAGFGYWRLSAPKTAASSPPAPTTTTAPQTSPQPSPSTTPHASVQDGHTVVWVSWIGAQ
ncbi:MAG TPA: hypothetical protein VF818_12845 [Ktedonobacterales bacterium]